MLPGALPSLWRARIEFRSGALGARAGDQATVALRRHRAPLPAGAALPIRFRQAPGPATWAPQNEEMQNNRLGIRRISALLRAAVNPHFNPRSRQALRQKPLPRAPHRLTSLGSLADIFDTIVSSGTAT